MTTLQASPFLERLLRFLMPYFTGVTPDLAAARAEALETLASYGARTRAELLNAAQIIIFGLCALETLGEANSLEMSSSLRLRFRGCANNLNRSGQKTEQTLLKRLACDVPSPTEQELINDVPEAQAEEILQQTHAAVEAYRNRASANRASGNHPSGNHPSGNHPSGNHPAGNHPAQTPPPPSASQQDRNKQLWGNAMMQTLAQMGMPVQPVTPT